MSARIAKERPGGPPSLLQILFLLSSALGGLPGLDISAPRLCLTPLLVSLNAALRGLFGRSHRRNGDLQVLHTRRRGCSHYPPHTTQRSPPPRCPPPALLCVDAEERQSPPGPTRWTQTSDSKRRQAELRLGKAGLGQSAQSRQRLEAPVGTPHPRPAALRLVCIPGCA